MKKLVFLFLLPLIGFGQVVRDSSLSAGISIDSVVVAEITTWRKEIPINTDNLLIYLPLNGNANDVSGNGYNGSATNGSYTTGKIGNAFTGDGNQDYITVADNNAFTFGNGTTDSAFSGCGWFLFNDDNQQSWLINKRASGLVQEYDLQFYEGVLAITLYSSGDATKFIRRSYNWVPTEGVFYHIAFTYDGSSTAGGLKLYIDGVEFGTTSTGGTYVAMNNYTAPLYIAAFGVQPTSTTRALDGKSTLIQVWAEELTEEKINAIIAKENAGQLITD